MSLGWLASARPTPASLRWPWLSEVTGLRVELDRLGGELAGARERLGDSGSELGQARALLADARALAARLRERRQEPEPPAAEPPS